MRNLFLFIWEIIKVAIVALVIVVPVRYFIFQPFVVRGESMEPNFHNGDYLIIDEISYRFEKPKRGDVIVFHYPNDPSQRYIKRIIGLPGERIKIENGKVYIFKNGKFHQLDESFYLPPKLKTPGKVDIQLGKDEYFVLGDNRQFSFDSREWGPLPRKEIIGKVYIRAWPFDDFCKIHSPVYQFIPNY